MDNILKDILISNGYQIFWEEIGVRIYVRNTMANRLDLDHVEKKAFFQASVSPRSVQ